MGQACLGRREPSTRLVKVDHGLPQSIWVLSKDAAPGGCIRGWGERHGHQHRTNGITDVKITTEMPLTRMACTKTQTELNWCLGAVSGWGERHGDQPRKHGTEAVTNTTMMAVAKMSPTKTQTEMNWCLGAVSYTKNENCSYCNGRAKEQRAMRSCVSELCPAKPYWEQEFGCTGDWGRIRCCP